MIKGRYVAQIEVDFTYDGEKADYKTVHDRLYGDWIDRSVAVVVEDVFNGGEPVITVTKQYANLYKLEDEKDDGREKSGQ